MGGRGSKSGLISPRKMPQQPPLMKAPTPQLNKAPLADQTPDDNNTPVQPDPLSSFTNMNDNQLAQFYRNAQHAQLPNHLDDAPDVTQRFVFAAGLNAKPMVLDSQQFDQFMQQNNIGRSQILSRSVRGGTLKTSAGGTRQLSEQDIIDMTLYSRLNYIGGKHGGQLYGAGTYFDMNGGRSTGYGNSTINAVLNPKTAKVITDNQLRTKARAFDRAHPQFARATGGFNDDYNNGKNNMSVYALVMGYNVIQEAGGSYHNIIDRSALVCRK